MRQSIQKFGLGLTMTLTLTLATLGTFILYTHGDGGGSEGKNLRAPAAVVQEEVVADGSTDASTDVATKRPAEEAEANCKQTQTEPSGTSTEVTQQLPQKLMPLIDPTQQINLVSQFFPMMMAFMNAYMQSMLMAQFIQPQLQLQQPLQQQQLPQPQISPLLNPMLNLSLPGSQILNPMNSMNSMNPTLGQWQSSDRLYAPTGFFAF